MIEWTRCDDDCKCHKCGGPTEYRIVEDSEGHEDVKHRCVNQDCGAIRYTDGIDS